MIRSVSSGPSALLRSAFVAILLVGAAVATAQESLPTAESAAKAPDAKDAAGQQADASQPTFHDLICKPNGSEDSFDCADEATPAKIVPIPSQAPARPRPQDVAVSA